jgi:toluene monooxygenase electron transfer component
VRIRVSARDGAHAFEVEPGEKILHGGLRSGVALPYECGTGTCGTCKARLVEGDVSHEWPEAPGQSGLRRDAGEFLMCQGVARSDCLLEVARVIKPMDPGACVPARLDAVLRGIAPLTHDVVSLDVELVRPIDWDAGQFMLMSAPGIVGARAYSMVTFERGAARLVFVVKKKPGGSMSEWLFDGAAAGSRVELFGPLGAATFRPDMDRHLLCVAGGSGIAGMMSILSRAVQDRYFEGHRGDVFFGVRTRRDTFFLEELAAAKVRSGGDLRVTIALSDEELDPALAARHPELDFDTGFVHAVAARRMKGRFENVRAYAAGPPPMVDATLRMLLLEGKLRANDIRYDKFS